MQGSPRKVGEEEREREREVGEETSKEGEEEESIYFHLFPVRRKLDYPVPYFIKMHFTDF